MKYLFLTLVLLGCAPGEPATNSEVLIGGEVVFYKIVGDKLFLRFKDAVSFELNIQNFEGQPFIFRKGRTYEFLFDKDEKLLEFGEVSTISLPSPTNENLLFHKT